MPEVTVVEVPPTATAALVPAHRRERVETDGRTPAEIAAGVRAALGRAAGGFTVTVSGDRGVALEPVAEAVRRYGDRLTVVRFDAHADPGALVAAVTDAGAVYVHVDLDVLDPEVFASVTALAGAFEIAGLGVTEYEPRRPEDRETLTRLVPAMVDACRESVVRQVERRAIAAWPAAVAEEHDGWLLRHTPGIRRRRSNSAVPPAGPGASVESVAAFYRERDRPVLIQLGPTELDASLAAQGYRVEAPTLVLTAFTEDVVAATPDSPADLRESPDGWLGVFEELDEHADSALVGERVISRIAPPVAFVSVPRDGRPAGMGLFAADAGWAGVFAMATRPDLRRRGVAAAVLGAGARWAARNGAHRMYLQVEEENAAARALYDRVGFTWSHGYHYRVSP